MEVAVMFIMLCYNLTFILKKDYCSLLLSQMKLPKTKTLGRTLLQCHYIWLDNFPIKEAEEMSFVAP